MAQLSANTSLSIKIPGFLKSLRNSQDNSINLSKIYFAYYAFRRSKKVNFVSSCFIIFDRSSVLLTHFTVNTTLNINQRNITQKEPDAAHKGNIGMII